jgi:hypothetical protein
MRLRVVLLVAVAGYLACAITITAVRAGLLPPGL